MMILLFSWKANSYKDLKKEFEKGNGLSCIIDNIPVNDLLYSYYESSFHIQNLFDRVLIENGAWERFCQEFDNKMRDKVVNSYINKGNKDKTRIKKIENKNDNNLNDYSDILPIILGNK